MTITIKLRQFIGLAAIIALAAVVLFAFQARANVITQGILPHVASSSLMAVGPQAPTTLFAGASNCTARVVTTYANPVMLSFISSLVPNATTGHLQSASTTVAYENADYGCGPLAAYGYSATTSITVTQLVQ